MTSSPTVGPGFIFSRQIDCVTPSPFGGSRLLSEEQGHFFLNKTQRFEEHEKSNIFKYPEITRLKYPLLHLSYPFASLPYPLLTYHTISYVLTNPSLPYHTLLYPTLPCPSLPSILPFHTLPSSLPSNLNLSTLPSILRYPFYHALCTILYLTLPTLSPTFNTYPTLPYTTLCLSLVSTFYRILQYPTIYHTLYHALTYPTICPTVLYLLYHIFYTIYYHTLPYPTLHCHTYFISLDSAILYTTPTSI